MYLPRVEVEGSLYNVVVPGATADAFFGGFLAGIRLILQGLSDCPSPTKTSSKKKVELRYPVAK
jgi:hypothetical protein